MLREGRQRKKGRGGEGRKGEKGVKETGRTFEFRNQTLKVREVQ